MVLEHLPDNVHLTSDAKDMLCALCLGPQNRWRLIVSRVEIEDFGPLPDLPVPHCKVATRTERQLRESTGIHLEPIKSNPPYLSIRLDRGPRAKVLIEGDTLVFLDLDPDHDQLCGQK